MHHKFYIANMMESKLVDENIDVFLKLVSGLSSVKVTISEKIHAIFLLSSLLSQCNQLQETLKYCRETLIMEDVTNAARSQGCNWFSKEW